MPSGRQPQEYDQMPRYEYTALPTTSSVRLLTDLHIDETADWSVLFEGDEQPIPKLVGSLQTVDLRDQPRYECLSYTWGPPDRVYSSKQQHDYTIKWFAQEFPIAIDGGVLWVGANLFTFLQHAVDFGAGGSDGLFKKTAGVTYSDHLWIDAMCINQQDDVEKGQQVKIMDQVYSNASVVLAWVGLSDKFTRRALEHLFVIAQLDEAAVERAKTTPLIHGDLSGFGFGDSKPGSELYAFFKSAYFRRAWILQEVVLAKRLLMCCGTIVLPFGFILAAAVNLYHTGWWLQLVEDSESRYKTGVGSALANLMGGRDMRGIMPFESEYEPDYERWCDPVYMLTEIGRIRPSFGCLQDQSPFQFIESGLERPSYMDIFTRYRVLESGDARDKIFAFLGLRPAGPFPEALQPTYTGDNTAGAVYTAATRYLIERDSNLDILCHRESRDPLRSQDLPSWVPNYEVNYIYSIGGSLTSTSAPWSAAGDRSRSTDIAFSESISLPVRGYRVDVIKSDADADLSELDGLALLLAQVKPETASIAVEDISACESTEQAVASGSMRGQSAQTVRAADSHDHDHGQRGDLETVFRQHMKIGNTVDTSHTSSEDADGTVQSPTEHKSKSVISDRHAVRNLQTRCEILWRTLLADTIKTDRPAPTNCGEAFAYTLYKRLKLLSGLVKHERLTASNSRRQPSNAEQETASSKFIRFVQAVEVLEGMERQDWDAIQSTPGGVGTAAPVLTKVLSDLAEHLLNPREAKDMSMPPAAPEFWKRMNQVERERSLFVTESRGYLGCGPAALEPGDEIWLLEGATVPFVLRPIAHGDIIQRFEVSGQVVELFELPPKDGYELVG